MKTDSLFERCSYTQEEFVKAVKTSGSVRQVLIKLNVSPKGGNYKVVALRIKKLKLDISHFHGQAWNKGKKMPHKRSIFDYLSNKIPIQSHKLKLRLLGDGVFEHKCFKCQRTRWNGKPIPIELEHIDGNHENNSLTNLRLLCPNCHAQTDTYRGKNKKT